MTTLGFILLYLSIGFGVWLVGLIHGDLVTMDDDDMIPCMLSWPAVIPIVILILISEGGMKLSTAIRTKIKESKNGSAITKPEAYKRRFDDLGRIVIPKDIREQRGIKAGDTALIYVEKGRIVIEPFVI